MSEPIVYVDRSTIRPEGIADVKKAIPELVAFIEENEPQLLSYGFHIDEGAMSMTVIAVHPDSASIELHMEIGGPRFREFAELIDMQGIEVYGEPSETVLALLRDKAEMLGDGGSVTVQPLHAGFARFASAGRAL